MTQLSYMIENTQLFSLPDLIALAIAILLTTHKQAMKCIYARDQKIDKSTLMHVRSFTAQLITVKSRLGSETIRDKLK